MLGSASTEMISNPKDRVNGYNAWEIVCTSITVSLWYAPVFRHKAELFT